MKWDRARETDGVGSSVSFAKSAVVCVRIAFVIHLSDISIDLSRAAAAAAV